MKRVLAVVFISLSLSAFAANAYVAGTDDSATKSHEHVHDAFVDEVTIVPSTLMVSVPDLAAIDFAAIEHERLIMQQKEIETARELHGKCGEWHSLATQIGWPEDEWKTLSQIMWRESKCQPAAWSGSDAGLMQINKVHTKWAAMMGWSWPEDLFVAENNLTFAYRLWSESGWSPWRFSGEIPD